MTDAEPDTVSAAADVLYAAEPESFLATRTELASAAKADGDVAAAKRIGALRKPTVAASLVNRLALADPSAGDRLADLSDRLRHAHDVLDAVVIRELTTERRALVAELTRAALKGAKASTAVRDEVTGTFDAAVADPDVTGRLGRLTKAERWSGFGVAPAGPPSLTVVRGGRSADTTAAERRSAVKQAGTPPAEKSSVPPAQRRKLSRALERAQAAFATAEAELTAADTAERAAGDEVRALITELAERQQRLEAAKREQDAFRRAARSARSKRREARTALDRAERNAERGS